jgi:hypothetical protein
MEIDFPEKKAEERRRGEGREAPRIFKSGLSIYLALLLATPLTAAGTQAADPDAQTQRPSLPRTSTRVPSLSFENSPRARDLIRSGNLYLSLSDAVALAIENNLDIEIQRFSLPLADADLLRAQGGGTLRGVPFILAEAPAGVGGPLSPLVTNPATASSVTPVHALAFWAKCKPIFPYRAPFRNRTAHLSPSSIPRWLDN